MARGRRVAFLACLVLLLLGLLPVVAADAAFSTRRALPSTSITMRTVVPATNVSAELSSCANNRWMNITVSWTGSPTDGVTGYLVTAHRSDGSTTTVAQTSSGTTSATTTVDKLSAGATTVTFVVVTQTSYGWTAESAPSGSLTC